MRVLIIGGAGMIGQKLAHHLVLNGLNNNAIDELILYDIVPPVLPLSVIPIQSISGTLQTPGETQKLAALNADVIFHLAAIVSGEAERNFDKGWDINARGSWQLLEAIREQQVLSNGSYRPRLVFASSIAVFGAPFPEVINDDFFCAPQTSYGAQKAMTELLISDYTRKGMVDGISIRLPTICVRPGKANLAASSFFSGIIREPLNGLTAPLPVSDQVCHTHASPRSAVHFLSHAAGLDMAQLNGRYVLNMPGVACTVAEQIEALRSIAGEAVVQLIKPLPNPEIIDIVKNWPHRFNPVRATELGFVAESTFEEIIQVYIQDDLNKPI